MLKYIWKEIIGAIAILWLIGFSVVTFNGIRTIHNDIQVWKADMTESNLQSTAEDSIYQEWALNVSCAFTEEFYNWGWDCGQLDEQPHFQNCIHELFREHCEPEFAAHWLETTWRKHYYDCLRKVSGTDNECEECFQETFGND